MTVKFCKTSDGWVPDRLNSRRLRKRFNKRCGNTTFSTLNVHNLGAQREDSDFHFSYCKSLGHDVTCLTETWNAHQRHESWYCVASADNVNGKERAAGVCLMLSARFVALQMQRGTLGIRGCFIRIQGPVVNLFFVGIYLPANGSYADTIELIRQLTDLLDE